MSKKALLIIDVQKDFTEGGALGCSGGKQAAQRILELMERGPYDLLVSSQDWHTAGEDNGGHFAAAGTEPNYSGTWPEHCVAGSEGAEYETPLREDLFDYRILKGQGKPAYSAFEGVEATSGESLAEVLRREGITQVDIAGIAFDYCVRASALDAVQEGFPVCVLEDLCPSVAEETRVAARSELLGAGIMLAQSTSAVK